MVTLSSFERRLTGASGEERDFSLAAGEVRWLDAQTHSGANIGGSTTHVLFVELKEGPGETDSPSGAVGPVGG